MPFEGSLLQVYCEKPKLEHTSSQSSVGTSRTGFILAPFSKWRQHEVFCICELSFVDIRLFLLQVWWLLKEPVFCCLLGPDLSSFTTDSSCKLDVFGHDGHSLGVDGAQVRVFKQTNKVGFTCFL